MMHETETHDGEIVEMHRFADIRTLLFNYKKEGRKEGRMDQLEMRTAFLTAQRSEIFARLLTRIGRMD